MKNSVGKLLYTFLCFLKILEPYSNTLYYMKHADKKSKVSSYYYAFWFY